MERANILVTWQKARHWPYLGARWGKWASGALNMRAWPFLARLFLT